MGVLWESNMVYIIELMFLFEEGLCENYEDKLIVANYASNLLLTNSTIIKRCYTALDEVLLKFKIRIK